MKAKQFTEEERGQVGIGTLIVFIAMVLVAAIAAGVLINTAGFLQSQSEQTGEESTAQVSDRLETVSVTGNVDTNEEINQIDVMVTKAAGANDIDMNATTAQLVGPDGTFNLVSSLVGGTNEFNITAFRDVEGSYPVLSDAEDRFIVKIPLASDAPITSASGATVTAIGQGELLEGETALLTLNTQAGGQTEIRLSVPDTLSGENSVTL
jgi:flagellin-like protein